MTVTVPNQCLSYHNYTAKLAIVTIPLSPHFKSSYDITGAGHVYWLLLGVVVWWFLPAAGVTSAPTDSVGALGGEGWGGGTAGLITQKHAPVCFDHPDMNWQKVFWYRPTCIHNLKHTRHLTNGGQMNYLRRELSECLSLCSGLKNVRERRAF